MFDLGGLSNTSCTRLEIHFSALLSLWFVLGLCRCSIYLGACSSRDRIAPSVLTCLHQGKQKCPHRLLMPTGRDFQYCSVTIAIAFTTHAYLSVQFPCSCNTNCLEIMCSHSPLCRLTAVCCSCWDYRLPNSMIQCESHSLIAQFNPCKNDCQLFSPGCGLGPSRYGDAGTSALTGSLCVLHPWLCQSQQSVKGQGLLLQSYLWKSNIPRDALRLSVLSVN